MSFRLLHKIIRIQRYSKVVKKNPIHWFIGRFLNTFLRFFPIKRDQQKTKTKTWEKQIFMLSGRQWRDNCINDSLADEMVVFSTVGVIKIAPFADIFA
jgi:hypothetical protein